ncbi:hypothetical protein BP5796_08528 [Coleophoma crateriformis]|uniref:FZ domain-containing protein n=1 Tax=Coleophoma crateriformis TaxID=565419 RepID=A0A3D8R875_9HELO|nr:hypothetical protein BP5796_08528 [Coleophoma crateriformis]
MPLPKLSPLQSRLAASLAASCMLLVLYFAFSSSHFAYAAELDSISPEDHNHERIQHGPILEIGLEELELRDEDYEAEFIGYDRGIIGRAAASTDPVALLNNRPALTNVPQGTTLSYMFSNESLWNSSTAVEGIQLPSTITRRTWSRNTIYAEAADNITLVDGESNDEGPGDLRLMSRQTSSQSNRTLWVTVSVCLQPESNDTSLGVAPQMSLYLSQSSSNTHPGPSGDASLQQMITLDGGWGMMEINATDNVYIGVSAPNVTGFTGPYSASIAASVNQPYHYYNDQETNLHLVDSDAQSALFITNNLTMEDANSTAYKSWMSMSPPFVLFANNQSVPSITGVQKSYCGLKNLATLPQSGGMQMGMTTSGLGNHPKQQFYMDALQKSTTYMAVVALPANTTTSSGVVGGGGEVWRATNFATLKDDNCAVIYNLSFCDQSSYSVPGNTNTFPNATALAAFYDNATQAQYSYFEKVLAQIPCETTSSAQYSLTKTCNDCSSAYKDWLCSVMIPRCTDFDSTDSWLQPRNMGQAFPNGTMLSPALVATANQSAPMNASRNAAIDTTVQPGPYKEVLPCDDLCFGIVQSCPSVMGFSCPMVGQIGFNTSYGERPNGSPEQAGQITCNFPGAAYFLAATGTRGAAPTVLVFLIATILGAILL